MNSIESNLEEILVVRDLRTYFFTRQGIGRAVDGVSFEVRQGETLGLVGESGCGKSVTALSIMGLHPKPVARIVGGRVLFRGKDLVKAQPEELRRYRGRHIAMILQDPMTALNPVFTIKDQLGEALRFHYGFHGSRLRERIIELMKSLRIPAPERRLDSYPHELSGGMRQRIVGAMALSCNPELLIADEPTTSVDVTVQAAFLALLKEIQQQSKVAILFITHDFGIVGKMCDRVAVMYAGKVVESGPTDKVLNTPAHPYTEALLKSVPDFRFGPKHLVSIEGDPPSIYNLPHGCPFAQRCPKAMLKCTHEFPPEVEVAEGHRTSCWLHV